VFSSHSKAADMMEPAIDPSSLKHRSFDSLRKLSEEGVKGEPTKLIVNVNKMLSTADRRMFEKEDESAFILYYRVALILGNCQKVCTSSRDLHKLDKVIGPYRSVSGTREILSKVLSICEGLTKRLKLAYSKKEHLPTIDLNSTKTDVNFASLITPNQVPKPKDLTSTLARSDSSHANPVWINCVDLYDKLTSEGDRTNRPVLFLDVRTSHSFGESCFEFEKLKKTKINYRLINVPEERIEQGLIAGQIGNIISPKDLDAFKKRKLARFVVLLDWNSENLESNEKLKIVYHALTKVICWRILLI
jgi:hypothetical protein